MKYRTSVQTKKPFAVLGISALTFTPVDHTLHASLQGTREIQLLRVIGAPPLFLFLLIQLEALFIALTSCALGTAILLGSLSLTQDYLASYFSLQISMNIFTPNTLMLIITMLVTSALAAVTPSINGCIKSKRYFLSDR